MESIFLFDVDGTLTLPRKRMSVEFAQLFDILVDQEGVYLVSGSDIEKIKEQVPHSILERCSGIFASSANEFWIGSKLQYENVYAPSDGVIEFLTDSLASSEYGTKTGKHIEHRPGMINFSTVGRSATSKQRAEYNRWDRGSQERKKIATELMAKHPELDVKVGGEISIDIYPVGLDKSQAVQYLREEYGGCQIVFFGDRTDKEGNDYSVVKEMSSIDIVHAVESCEDTYQILKNYLGYENE
jgi:phosphomannomutase